MQNWLHFFVDNKNTIWYINCSSTNSTVERGDIVINLDYRSGKSIHEQICDGIKGLMVNGILKENDQLPSVRELSLQLTINPNTVQKAYKQLENEGVIYSVKGKGNFVAKIQADERKINELLNTAEKQISEMKFMGVEKSKLLEMIDKIYEKEQEND